MPSVRPLAFALTALGGACNRPTVVAPAARVPAGQPAVLSPPEPLPDPGPHRDLCVAVAPPDRLILDWHPDVPPIATRDGRRVSLSVTLVRVDGTRQELRRGGAVLGTERAVCFAPDSGAAVRAVELRASDSVAVGRVTWFSGRRHGFI